MNIGVAYKQDISPVRQTVDQVADLKPMCLQEPKSVTMFLGFGGSSIVLQSSISATRESFLHMRNSVHESVKRAFHQLSIEIPFPDQTLYAGSGAFPVRFADRGDTKRS
jgi:small-conductance mechanosensitive channel